MTKKISHFFNDTIIREYDIRGIYDQTLFDIDAKILGPVNAPIYRINQKFRNRLLIRAKKTSSVQKKLKDVLKDFQLSKGMKLSVDVDPISFN